GRLLGDPIPSRHILLRAADPLEEGLRGYDHRHAAYDLTTIPIRDLEWPVFPREEKTLEFRSCLGKSRARRESRSISLAAVRSQNAALCSAGSSRWANRYRHKPVSADRSASAFRRLSSSPALHSSRE